MRFIIVTISLVLVALRPQAQQVLNTSGRSHTNGGLQLDWSLGEIGVQAIKTDFVWSTEGVLQPQAGTTTQLPPALANLPSIAGYGLDNAGTTFVNTSNGNSLMLEFTLGEPASKTLTAPGRMVTQGLLQPYINITNSPLPVTGLEFYAKRLSGQQVQLDWKTLQEVNNRGFRIERRKEGEGGFSDLRFVPSGAPGGNSNGPLSYIELDTNGFAGKTWYRLRQEDFDNRVAYSAVRIVSGSSEKLAGMKVWPIPARGEFHVLTSGTGNDVLQLFDAAGRLVKQTPVREGQAVTISGVLPGSYFLKLQKSEGLVQKIQVQ